ncbi:MAG: ABC transporter permease [Acidimicrobiales bacterium]
MLRLTLANLRAHPVRFITTMLAIIVGTGFLAGTLVLGDSLGPALRSNAVVALRGVDAAVEPSLREQNNRGPRGLTTGAIPESALAEVKSTDGVADAAGILHAELSVLDDSGQVLLKNATGSMAVPVPALDPFRVTEGHEPTAAGEITIDEETAKRKGWTVGDDLQLATTSGGHQVRVVGITRYGDQASSGAAGDIVVSQADGFDFLASGASTFDAIYVTGTDGITQEDLAVSLSDRMGDRFTVQTGDELRADEAGSAASLADVIGTGLQVFAWIARFVGGVIIYNTFSIVVAQRLREFALLRAIGASGKQVRRAVLLEATIVGIVASAVGVAVGLGLFFALRDLVPQFKALTGPAGIGLRLRPSSVLEVLLVGVIVTVISAFVPAFRASRTKPMAALRTATLDRSGTNRFRAVVGLIGIATGAVALLVGMAVSQPLVIALGPILLFLGVLIGGPVLANGFSVAIGSVLGRLGIPSRLAVANARRNPSRTATTANALLIGVFLVVFVTAAGGAVRDYAVEKVTELGGADLAVTSRAAGIDPDLQHQIEATDGVKDSTAIYHGVGVTGTDGAPVAAVDFARAASVLELKTSAGSLDDMGPDDIAMIQRQRGPGSTESIPLGTQVPVQLKNGASKMFTVAATIRVSLDAPGDLISADAARAEIPDLLPNSIALSVDSGSIPTVQQSLEDLTVQYSSVRVTAGNQFASLVKGLFNAIISSVNALLGLAVVIAVFGIVNTLILSVVERTPEIGLLRAVGMTRAQLRSSIRSESVIVAGDGTAIGMIFGLFVAWAVTQPIYRDGESFSWPFRELAVIALLGFAIGIVASLIPAWRASRLDVLDAIRSE